MNGAYDRNYTLAYNAASSGQTITVSWVMTGGTGNVTLNGAALVGGGTGSQGALAGTGTSSMTAGQSHGRRHYGLDSLGRQQPESESRRFAAFEHLHRGWQRICPDLIQTTIDL